MKRTNCLTIALGAGLLLIPNLRIPTTVGYRGWFGNWIDRNMWATGLPS